MSPAAHRGVLSRVSEHVGNVWEGGAEETRIAVVRLSILNSVYMETWINRSAPMNTHAIGIQSIIWTEEMDTKKKHNDCAESDSEYNNC